MQLVGVFPQNGFCLAVCRFNDGANLIVNLSGRGDKDMDIIKQYLGNKYHMPEESED